jgi:hypothetical protein
MSVPLFYSGLLHYAVERTRCQIVAWVSSNRHAALFDGVLKLAVASFLLHEAPAIIDQQFKDFPDLHLTSLTTLLSCFFGCRSSPALSAACFKAPGMR